MNGDETCRYKLAGKFYSLWVNRCFVGMYIKIIDVENR